MLLSPKLEVSGMFFPLSDPFSKGHVCTEAEATALNSLRRDNLRAAMLRLLKKKYPSATEASPSIVKDFLELAENYEFTRTSLAKPQDPVESRAYAMAKDLAEAVLKRENVSKDSLLPGKFEEMISTILLRKPEIMEEAKKRVNKIKQMAEQVVL